jgi:hypothetical protein
MLSKVLRVVGWLVVTAGALICLLCVLMLFNRSPADFEGTIVGAAIGGILVIGLPTLVVGLLIVSFARRPTGPGAA